MVKAPGANWQEISINELDLERSIKQSLLSAQINTVQDIIDFENSKGLTKIKNVWTQEYKKIASELYKYGIIIGSRGDGYQSPSLPAPVNTADTAGDSSASPAQTEDEVPDAQELLEIYVQPHDSLLSTAVFVDYEHWFRSLHTEHKRKPNIRTWLEDAMTRGLLQEVTFFGDFSKDGGMEQEINRIRLFTSRVIETKNIDPSSSKDFTDFFMLDAIYQKLFTSPEIEQIILFTGDGHFSSVASYARNFHGKIVGVYGVANCISRQLTETVNWCIEIPFDMEIHMECREAILANLKSCEQKGKKATFLPTVRAVAEYYDFDEDLVHSMLRQMLEEGILYQVPERTWYAYKEMVQILKVNWSAVARNTQYMAVSGFCVNDDQADS